MATLLLFLSRTGEQNHFAIFRHEQPWRWAIAFVGISLLTLWGLWSWPRIRVRCQTPDGPLIFRGGVLGWGGAMVLLSSWQQAQYITGRQGTLHLGPRSFLAELLLNALIAWPIYSWLGYWFGVITFRSVRGLLP